MADARADRGRDEIPLWPDVQLDILREYAAPFSEVLSKRAGIHHVYVEAFPGARAHLAKPTQMLVPGNPLNALAIQPPFKEILLIDTDGTSAGDLRALTADRGDVHVLDGEINAVLLEHVFPQLREEDHHRGLCVLHPLGWSLDWAVFNTLGGMQTVEIFFHFPMSAVGPLRLDAADESLLRRVDRFWGDDNWRKLALPGQKQVQSPDPIPVSGEAVVEGFRKRLINDAGFKFVPKPLPLADASGEIADYLFFASHNMLGGSFVEHIFEKHAHRAEVS